MRRLAIPLGAIFVAVAAWAGIASALAGSDAPPTNDAPAYRRHASTPPPEDAAGPRVDAEVQLEPPAPAPAPVFIPQLSTGSATKAQPAKQEAPAKATSGTTTGARNEAAPEPRQQSDRRGRQHEHERDD